MRALVFIATTTLMSATWADMQEIAPSDMNNAYIPGISIPKVSKNVPCAGKKEGVSQCQVATELRRKEEGQNDTNTSPIIATNIVTKEALPVLTAPLADQRGQLPSTGVVSQSGQQVMIQLVAPMPLSSNSASPGVNINTSPNGATILFNLPPR